MPSATAEMLADIKPSEGPRACTWSLDVKNRPKCPHANIPLKPKPKIMDTILDNVGNTPLVRINNITKAEGITCEILAKCEFFNAGGSVKDRIGKRMVMEAELSGRIQKGDTIIEPTSGNTGIGMALACALLGYRMIVTMPEKMSKEKVDVLKALGAECVRTPNEAAFDSPDSHIGVAKRLQSEIPNAHILDQYSNPNNPLAHYEGTAMEIIEACDGKIDAIVVAAGTGGTITGIARRFKELLPNCEVVGVDPIGSILALPETLNVPGPSYHLEGTGYDFIPDVLDRKLVDRWIKNTDKPSFIMSRRLIKEEGLLCGGSAGSAMVAALEVARNYGPGQRVVCLFADSVRNYMTKFLSDDWMIQKGFMEPKSTPTEWWHVQTMADLKLQTPVTCSPEIDCGTAVEILASQGYDQLPVVNADGQVLGMVTNGNLLAKIGSGLVSPQSPVTQCLFKQYAEVSASTPLQRLCSIFEHDHFAIVVATQKRFLGGGKVAETKVVTGVATRIDLIQHISQKKV